MITMKNLFFKIAMVNMMNGLSNILENEKLNKNFFFFLGQRLIDIGITRHIDWFDRILFVVVIFLFVNLSTIAQALLILNQFHKKTRIWSRYTTAIEQIIVRF